MLLFANGCSLTEGHELGGVTPNSNGVLISVDPVYKENNAWPKLLANKLNMDCVNHAQAGGSNDRIIRTTLDWTATYLQDNKAEDLFVVIGWTSSNRTEFNINGQWCHILPQWETAYEDRIVRKVHKFYKTYIYDEDVDAERKIRNVLLLQSWLKVNKISYIFCNCLIGDSSPLKYETRTGKELNISNNIDSKLYYGYNNPVMYMNNVCKGLPHGQRGHPLGEGHKLWADTLYKYIKENNL